MRKLVTLFLMMLSSYSLIAQINKKTYQEFSQEVIYSVQNETLKEVTSYFKKITPDQLKHFKTQLAVLNNAKSVISKKNITSFNETKIVDRVIYQNQSGEVLLMVLVNYSINEKEMVVDNMIIKDKGAFVSKEVVKMRREQGAKNVPPTFNN